MRILYVEDDLTISKAVKDFLESKNFSVIVAHNFEDAQNLILESSFDLILLDLMLQNKNGLDLYKFIKCPVIVLSALSDDETLIKAFSLGITDYLKKPFSLKELHIRIVSRIKIDLVYNDDLVVNKDSLSVKINGDEILLTNYEMQILLFLIQHPHQVFSREQIIEKAFVDYSGFDRTIDSHIKNLRKKIEVNNKYICTVRGFGYKFIGEKNV